MQDLRLKPRETRRFMGVSGGIRAQDLIKAIEKAQLVFGNDIPGLICANKNNPMMRGHDG